MGDLQNPRLIKLKGLLFLVLGVLYAALLVFENFSWWRTLYLALCIWSFCRFYYFAFYVIEHYVDRQFRFSGLFDFTLYLWNKERWIARMQKASPAPSEPS